MKRLLLTILVLFFILLTCNERVSQKSVYYNPDTAWIDYNQEKIHAIDSVLKYYHQHYSFHGNVLVSDNGHILYRGSFGNKGMKKVSELNQNSIFQLASLSKQFTAVAIMMLEEQGLLSYNDSLVKYIPELPWPGVKIIHLLQHTAGLPNYFYIVEKYWKEDIAPNNSSIIQLIAEHKDEMGLYFSPGRRYNYSNTGYMVLATLVERISGQSFPEFMQENIFGPADMKNSFICYHPPSTRKNVVLAYRRGRTRYIGIPPTVNDGSYGDKGVYSNTYDLYLWNQALISGKLISRETLLKAGTPLMLRNKYRINYGFGFRIKDIDEKRIMYHHGRWNGFRTSLWLYPKAGSSIIILNNSSFPSIGSLERRIQKILLTD